MPESFIPVWMSLGEAEEFRRFLQEEARSTDGEFPEREFDLIDSSLREERPRSFETMEKEQAALAQAPTLSDEDRERLEEIAEAISDPDDAALLRKLASQGMDSTLSQVRSQIEALRVYSDEDIALKTGAFEGWVRIDDVLNAFPQGTGGDQ